MAISWIDISAEAYQQWSEVRGAVAEGIGQCVPANTRVYPNWVYEIDVNSMLGKVTSLMRTTEAPNAGQVHCWTIGINSASYVKNAFGDNDIIGAYQWTWNIVLDVWGFFNYDGLAVTQANAENEARLVSAFFFRNSGQMVQGLAGLSRVGLLEYGGIQPSPFSDGSNVIVASGKMPIQIREALTV